MVHLVVCKCDSIKDKGFWKFSSVTLSSFAKQMCKTDEPNVQVTLLITRCPLCKLKEV